MTTRHRILRLLQDGRFHSGESLGRSLGVSRAAVWKALHGLPELGVHLDAVTGRGYRLAEPLELLDRDAILAVMGPSRSDRLAELELFEVIDSTNAHLMERAGQGAPGGTVCLAEYQAAGRGRHGRSWISPFGSNLYLSALWRYQEGPAVAQGLSLAIGVMLVEALEAVGIAGARLKWPNDVLWQDAKLAGVLVEMAGESSGPCHVVVGIGLNVCMPRAAAAAIDQPWIDLHHASADGTLSRNRLAGVVVDGLLELLSGYAEVGLGHYLPRWRALDALRDRSVMVQTVRGEVVGRGCGVDEAGALQVSHGGRVETFHAAEVSLRGAF